MDALVTHCSMPILAGQDGGSRERFPPNAVFQFSGTDSIDGGFASLIRP